MEATTNGVPIDEEMMQFIKETIKIKVREMFDDLRVTKKEFPRYGGKGVRGWLYKCEYIFRANNVLDEHKVTLISKHLFDIALMWHEKFVSIMGENVTWMIYKDAILKRFANSFDGLNMQISSNGVKESSVNSRLVDKLEELFVNDSHFLKTNTCVYNMFDEMPIKKSLEQEGVKEASDKINDKSGKMVLDKAFKECGKVKEFDLIDSSKVDNGIKNIKEIKNCVVNASDTRKQKEVFREDIENNGVIELNDQGEVNDNKRVVIMDEREHLVKSTSLLNLTEMINGFDDKLDEVIVTDMKVNLSKKGTLDGVVMDGEPLLEKHDKKCSLNLEVRQAVNENNLSVCVILESRVDIHALSLVCSKVCRTWEWTSNMRFCNKGCRIILGWNKDVVDLMVVAQSSQAIHAKFIHKADKKFLFCTFIYAGNHLLERRILWAELGLHKIVVPGAPWTLLGDFNVALNMEDQHFGSSSMDSAMCDFKDYVKDIEVFDINSFGLHFTWNQKPKGSGGILKKLDQIMGNTDFVDLFPGAYAIFQPYRISDHSPSELDEVQKALDFDPSNSVLREEEAIYVQAFNNAKLDEERFLKQKAKIKWLDVGDSNSAYFHKTIKSQNQRSRIDAIINGENMEVTGDAVPNVFVSHYESFLGTDMVCELLDSEGLFHKQVSDSSNEEMTRPITDVEIKRAMFGIGNDKAPGPDGFTSVFFKKSWDIVGQDVCKAVRDFFRNGKLLKEINHTFIALIPKVTTPQKVTDYRSISCCNVIYKCISKILTNRIIGGIKEVVSENQSAFVLGRRISDNILITQELMHNYHLDRGPPRCAFKVDIQNAYDTVDWRFLGHILKCFGFHPVMIQWIMACVTSTSFSISINGDIHGFFKGKRGLRQGDPLYPYLFTLVMEILTLILQRRVRMSDSFRYHKQCEELKIINVCSADDLFLFARGDVASAMVIMESLNEFQHVSGLIPSIPKSMALFCNVVNRVKVGILSIMSFSESVLPVKYLGVPLISSRLLNKDCKILVEKARNRIGDWKNKSLSFSGRLQLCKSVISAMQVYWASAKVAWESICLPKSEGGLGLGSLEVFNLALMTTHIWNIVTHKESLWVHWIHMYKLRGRSLWEVQPKSNMSWGWRKILQLHEQVRPFIWDVMGNGHKTSLWHDHWCIQSPLGRHLSPRDLARDGYNLRTYVSNLVVYGGWNWPSTWLAKAHILVWRYVRAFTGMDNVNPTLVDIMLWCQPLSNKCMVKGVVEFPYEIELDGFDTQMEATESMGIITKIIKGKHILADKPLVENFVKKNGQEGITMEVNVANIRNLAEIRKEEAFADDRKYNTVEVWSISKGSKWLRWVVGYILETV
ncbi:hypothetical protein Tco_0876464 [Tanacetum coccineum]|uniref:Reverse transcriptase domain-containing protein n=1 Tax=Tanacetum coccineum TaxID=301880 RepID=A0ABQ5BVI1_9ASTR